MNIQHNTMLVGVLLHININLYIGIPYFSKITYVVLVQRSDQVLFQFQFLIRSRLPLVPPTPYSAVFRVLAYLRQDSTFTVGIPTVKVESYLNKVLENMPSRTMASFAKPAGKQGKDNRIYKTVQYTTPHACCKENL